MHTFRKLPMHMPNIKAAANSEKGIMRNASCYQSRNENLWMGNSCRQSTALPESEMSPVA
jgi:hypothetical protein